MSFIKIINQDDAKKLEDYSAKHLKDEIVTTNQKERYTLLEYAAMKGSYHCAKYLIERNYSAYLK